MADLTTNAVVVAVRAKLADTAFDQAIILDGLNAFVSELYHNTRTRRMETSDQLFISAGDTTAELPDDIDKLIRLTLTSPTVYDLTRNYVEYGDFMRLYPQWQTYTAQAPRIWTDFGNEIRFAAPIDLASTIDIDYIRTPVLSALVTTTPTDTVELDDSYKELAVIGTIARCMEANEDYGEAANERANLEPLVVAWVRNEGRGGLKTGPTVMRQGRHRKAWSTNDF